MTGRPVKIPSLVPILTVVQVLLGCSDSGRHEAADTAVPPDGQLLDGGDAGADVGPGGPKWKGGGRVAVAVGARVAQWTAR